MTVSLPTLFLVSLACCVVAAYLLFVDVPRNLKYLWDWRHRRNRPDRFDPE